MKVLQYSDNKNHNYPLPRNTTHYNHRHQKMNIDDLLEYGVRGRDNLARSNDDSNSPKQYSESTSGSYSSFLNPHAAEFGAMPSSTSASLIHKTTSSPPQFSVSNDHQDLGRRPASYVVQEPNDQLSMRNFGDDVNGENYFSSNAQYSSHHSSFSGAHGMSRSQEYFDDYSAPRIHQQRPKQFPEQPLNYPSNPPQPPQLGPLRTRSTGNMLPKNPSFRSNHPLPSYSDSSYQSQMAFSFDQGQPSLSSFGEDIYAYSPLRTPTTGAPGNNWSGNSTLYPPPTLTVGQTPSLAPTSKNRDQKRSAVPIDGFVYQVQFKRAHRNFVLAPSASRDIIPGDFVKVEADRGEDMGIVLAKIPADSFEEAIPTAGYRGRGFSSGQGERKYLYRRATTEERASLAQKVADEEKTLETVREKSRERNLPMKVLDAEYQFDRHKLTFYFESDKRIDFRDLVSELFSQYKTRIWMQQVDTSSLTVHDAGTELARATGFLPQRDDDFTAYNRSTSFGSAGTMSTLDTLDTSKGSAGGLGIGGPSTLDGKGVVATSSSASSSLFQDPWGTYRF